MADNLGFKPTTKESGYGFVSYNSGDAKRVGEFLRELRRRYYIDLWYDEGIIPGDKWEATIAEKISKSRYIIMFISKGILEKGTESYVYQEYNLAKGHRKNIIIIQMDNTAGIPLADVPAGLQFWWEGLKHVQSLPLWQKGKEETIKKLAETLKLKPRNQADKQTSAGYKPVSYQTYTIPNTVPVSTKPHNNQENKPGSFSDLDKMLAELQQKQSAKRAGPEKEPDDVDPIFDELDELEKGLLDLNISKTSSFTPKRAPESTPVSRKSREKSVKTEKVPETTEKSKSAGKPQAGSVLAGLVILVVVAVVISAGVNFVSLFIGAVTGKNVEHNAAALQNPTQIEYSVKYKGKAPQNSFILHYADYAFDAYSFTVEEKGNVTIDIQSKPRHDGYIFVKYKLIGPDSEKIENDGKGTETYTLDPGTYKMLVVSSSNTYHRKYSFTVDYEPAGK